MRLASAVLAGWQRTAPNTITGLQKDGITTTCVLGHSCHSHEGETTGLGPGGDGNSRHRDRHRPYPQGCVHSRPMDPCKTRDSDPQPE
jgi:hypothetical protein